MATIVQVRDLVPAGMDPTKRVPFPVLDNIVVPNMEDLCLTVINLRLALQLVIKYGGLTEAMDLRVFFETLMMDNRFKEVFKEPSVLRLLSEMYGWSDVSDGVKGNNSMTQKGKKFSNHVLKRMWQGNYCTFCGHICGKPMVLSYDQALQAEQIRLPHVRSLLHVVLCKTCVSQVMVVQSRVSTMAPGRGDMLRAVLDHLPTTIFNGGKWWLRSSVIRCLGNLEEHMGDIDEEIEKAHAKLEELKRKKQINGNYKELLEKHRPADLSTLLAQKKRKAEPEEDDDDDDADILHIAKKVPNPDPLERPDSKVASSSSSSSRYTPPLYVDSDDSDDDDDDEPFSSRVGCFPALPPATTHVPPPASPLLPPSSPMFDVISPTNYYYD